MSNQSDGGYVDSRFSMMKVFWLETRKPTGQEMEAAKGEWEKPDVPEYIMEVTDNGPHGECHIHVYLRPRDETSDQEPLVAFYIPRDQVAVIAEVFNSIARLHKAMAP